MGYILFLRDGTRFELDDGGAVVFRSDGPRGWDYSGDWVVLGFSKRWHSARIISLEEATNGEDVGQGWVHDLDHGVHRMWGHPTGRRLRRIETT